MLHVQNISKSYKLGQIGFSTFQDEAVALLNSIRGKHVDKKNRFYAIKDVSFSVEQGKVLGVIGHNGAGKSTLLKLISRITEPDCGSIRFAGRIASLLEVGTGFHPELTGRENIYLNGTILGMKKREIDESFDDIVSFAGVETFVDTPIKRYSSGMTVRLGFAVAAFLRPEILIIDEVLAVGDLDFQRRCLGKIQDVSQSGKTILFVSHNMSSIQKISDHVLYLENGRVKKLGETKSTIAEYVADSEKQQLYDSAYGAELSSSANGLTLTELKLLATVGESSHTIHYGDDIKFLMKLDLERPISDLIITVRLLDKDNDSLAAANSRSRLAFAQVAGKLSLTVTLSKIALSPGEYGMKLKFFDTSGPFLETGRILNFIVDETPVDNSQPHTIRRDICISPFSHWKLEKSQQ